MTHALGIDVGSTNVKVVLAAVGDAADDVREVARASRPTPATAGALLDAVRDAAGEVLTGRPAPDVVGVASMAETGVALDADDAPVTPLVRWDGTGSAAHADQLARDLGRDALFAATGVRASAKVPLATLARLQDDGVPLVRWAGVADLVVLALTGELVTDHTLAGRSMAYRVDAAELPRTFDADLLAHVGLTPAALPRVAGPHDVAACVRPGPWTDVGLRAGTPVVVAGHDHAVGTWAAGVRAPGERADSLGTAEAVATVLDGPPADPVRIARAGMSLVRTPGGGHALQAGSSSAGAVLAWWASEQGDDVATLLAEARDVPGPTGVVVGPWLRGRQCPDPDPDARLDLDTGGRSRPVLTRALVEAVCLQARWMLAEQARLGGVPDDAPVTVLGGALLADPLWRAVKAQVHPHALHRVAVTEPVATGAALLAVARVRGPGPGSGVPAYDDAPDPLRTAPHLPHEPGRAPATDRYRRALDALVERARHPSGPVLG